jgi:2-keto-myo-inositol isomerase
VEIAATSAGEEDHVTTELKRRDLLGGSAAVIASGVLGSRAFSGPAKPGGEPFRLGLNTSTIRGQKLSIVDEVAIAAKAGYQALEPWIDELERYAKSGGSLEDLGKRLKDAGITVESAIGFSEWIVDDPDRRKKGLESVRRAMELVQRIGGTRLAAPPVGATDRAMGDLLKVAERYRTILDLGDQIGVVPEVEIWGPSRTLSRLGEAAFVAIESGHPKACILPDVYHLYRGGSDIEGIKLLSPSAIHVIHFNDYPADPPRARITDADRVFPGDGIAPLKKLLGLLAAGGFQVTLSLELFNRKYWSEDALRVAKTGLEKMKTLVAGYGAKAG